MCGRTYAVAPQPVAVLVGLIKGEQVIRAGVEGGLRVRAHTEVKSPVSLHSMGTKVCERLSVPLGWLVLSTGAEYRLYAHDTLKPLKKCVKLASL